MKIIALEKWQRVNIKIAEIYGCGFLDSPTFTLWLAIEMAIHSEFPIKICDFPEHHSYVGLPEGMHVNSPTL